MAKQLSDEQIGQLYRVATTFMERTIHGDIPFDNALEVLNRAIRGHGYLGNQIAEGDDIRLAILAMKSIHARYIEIAINATGMAAIGARYERVPAQYRIIASIKVDELAYNGTSVTQYVRGRFFHYLPITHGIQFDYWHELAAGGEVNIDFPATTVPMEVHDFVRRMLESVGGPVLEKVKKGTTIYLLQTGHVLTDEGITIG
jgi:hypothetical protein